MARVCVWEYVFTPRVRYLSFLLLLSFGRLFGDGSPISSPERHRAAPGLDDGRGGVVDPSFLEQDAEVDVQNLLETARGQFLRTFNLSGHRLSVQPGGQRVEPPEYMLELYNRFANDRTSMPSADIVRSFENEESSPSLAGPDGVRRHPLVFNVSIPHHERVTAAELRLYTLVQTDRHLYAGVDRKVTVYEVARGNDTWAGPERGEEEARLVELASRQVYGADSGWETFDMTAAVQQWRERDYDGTHGLEVHIESLNLRNGSEVRGPAAEGSMELDTDPGERHKPLIIVFSNDRSTDHRGERQELSEMIRHEVPSQAQNDNLEQELTDLWGELGTTGRGERSKDDDPDEAALLQMRSNLIYDTASRIRRNAKGNQCKKSSLYVDFKDIGWDSWILEPQGYEAYECTGVCTYPLTNHVTPTKHAIIQTLASLKSPKTVSRACCVPTKLDPISLLYLDDSGVVTYQYKYEGMVVAECGCR